MTKLAFANGLVLAVQTIRSHKMRAFLTVLGVIIGTGTIIGVAAILTGFDANMTAVLRSFGPNSIIVFKFPVGFRVNNLSPEERTRKNLTYENAVHLRERCRSVENVSAMLFPSNGMVNAKYMGNDMYDINLFGVEEGYATGSGQVDIRVGRFFTDEESHRRMPVAVIGADIEKGLFANLDPLSKTITVGGHEFTVIGTMLRPCISAGIAAPAASRNVSAKSRLLTMSLLTVPGLVTPGQRTSSGVRRDCSKIQRLSNQPCSPR